MVPPLNLLGSFSTHWMKCTRVNCETYVDTYIPLPFQQAVHSESTRHIGVFGGYGSGKTTLSMKDDQKHILSTPNGATLVGSAVLNQVQSTYEKDFQQDFPIDLLLGRNKTKNEYTFLNGHMMYIRSLYEEGLIRSLTLSRYHIVEASEVDHEIAVQLHARLRSLASTIPELDEDNNMVYDPLSNSFKVKADWSRGFVESNPDVGWIRSNFLLKSGKISLFGQESHTQEYYVEDPNENYHSFIIPTNANKYLPPNFASDLAKGKAAWWVRRYLQGSFDYAEGMVYPEALRAIVSPIQIPKRWKRLIAMDYGIRDETCILFGAIDPENAVLYIYHEIYINNVNYRVIAQNYKNYVKDPDNVPYGSILKTPVMDARSINKRNDYNLKTIGELFLEEGIYFSPAQMDLDVRILKTNTMIELGQLRIFNTCKNLCREILDYKFPDRTADGRMRPGDDKPVDKKNHAINALEFLVMEAPHDLKNINLLAYHGSGRVIEAYSNQKTEQLRKINPYDPFGDESPKENDQDVYGDYGKLFEGGVQNWKV